MTRTIRNLVARWFRPTRTAPQTRACLSLNALGDRLVPAVMIPRQVDFHSLAVIRVTEIETPATKLQHIGIDDCGEAPQPPTKWDAPPPPPPPPTGDGPIARR